MLYHGTLTTPRQQPHDKRLMTTDDDESTRLSVSVSWFYRICEVALHGRGLQLTRNMIRRVQTNRTWSNQGRLRSRTMGQM